MKKQKSVLSFSDWKRLFGASFKALPQIWWRIVVINLLVILTFFVGIGIVLGTGIFLFRGVEGTQNVLLNLHMTGNIMISQIWILVGLIFFLINWIIVFGMIGKIASLMIVKDYTKQKTSNPVVLYFQESWHFFWRYVMVGIRVFLYMVWPILLLIVAGGIIGILFIQRNELEIESISAALFIVVLGCLYVYFLIKRSVNILFAQSKLIADDKGWKEAFDGSIALVKGNWWRVFIGFFGFIFIVVTLPSIVFRIASEVFHNIEPSLLEMVFLCYFFFIVAPVGVGFLYFLMLHIGKKKNIK